MNDTEGLRYIHARKRRRIMQAPEGFTVSPNVPKVHVPQCAPAFDDSEVVHKSASAMPKHERVITRPQFNLPATSNSKPTLQAAPASKRAPKTVSLTRPASKGNLKKLEAPNAESLVNPDKLSLDLRPLNPPISFVESQGNIATTPLHPIPPPPPIRPPETPSKPHRALNSLGPPPALPHPFPTPAKSMRTISTTHIAFTNDLSTENGKAELASMLLHDQHPEILAHAEDDEIGNLNLGVSPQKMGRSSKGKGKEPKFVRYDIYVSFRRV